MLTRGTAAKTPENKSPENNTLENVTPENLPQANAPGSDGFRPELESLRGIAALLVAGFHILQANILINGVATTFLKTRAAGIELLHVFCQGQAPVTFFFVLSGFVLVSSLMRHAAQGADVSLQFIVSRIFRIYPAWIFAIAMFVVVFVLTGWTLDLPDYTADQVWRNLALVSVSMNGVGWSIQTEMLAIPIVLLAFYLIQTRRVIWLVIMAAVLLALARPLNGYLNLDGGPPRAYFMYCFAVGALACVALPRTPARFAGILFWSGVLMFFGALHAVKFNNNQTFVVTMGSAVIIIGASLGTGAVSRALRSNAVLRFFGKISYSFYVLHPLTLLLFWQMPELLGQTIAAGVPPFAVVLTIYTASVALAAPLAYFSYRMVERPFIRFGKRLLALRMPGVATTEQA